MYAVCMHNTENVRTNCDIPILLYFILCTNHDASTMLYTWYFVLYSYVSDFFL